MPLCYLEEHLKDLRVFFSEPKKVDLQVMATEGTERGETEEAGKTEETGTETKEGGRIRQHVETIVDLNQQCNCNRKSP